MNETVSIAGLDKAAVLAALYNEARVQGMGFLQAKPGDMTVEQARELIARFPEHDRRIAFDYLYGRVMKIDIGEDDVNPRLYDRDNGEGACSDAIARLRASR